MSEKPLQFENERVIILTNHAIERFKERFKPLDEFDWIPENEEEWREKIKSLFQDSIEVDIKSVKAIERLINSGGQDARYFYNKVYHLRFVVIEENGSFIIKTIEEPIERRRGYKSKEE